MTPDALVGLLAEPSRMRIFAAVVLGATSPAEVGTRTGASVRAVAEALRRLTDGGLVTASPTGLEANLDAFKEAMRSRPVTAEEPMDPDRVRDSVLRTFIVDGRLTTFPAQQSRRRIVLEHIVASFEPGIRYPEREVDAILRAWHDDHAALRRYLVDEDLLARDANIYWRIGGPVTAD
jgi:hypothetical protein